MKTRVYVEQSDVETNYYPQIQHSFMGIKYWHHIDIMTGSHDDVKAISKVLDGALKGTKFKRKSKEYAELVCKTMKEILEEKQKAAKHNKTKKVWWYLFPEEK